MNPLPSPSNSPDNKSLPNIVRRLAHVAHSQGYTDALNLGAKVQELLLRPKEPLPEEELNRIMDVLTSPLGSEVLARVNGKAFIKFLEDMASREQSLAELTTTELDIFQEGGIGRHQQLRELGALLRAFADEERSQKPAYISAEGIWNQVQRQQHFATISHDRKLFNEACTDGSTQTLHTWDKTDGVVELRYDPTHNLLGGWDNRPNKNGKPKGDIIGRKVLSGFQPAGVDMFYSNGWFLPCLDKNDNLCLVEFDPDGMSFFFSESRNYFSIVPSDSITDRGIIRTLNGEDEIFYCVDKNGGAYHVTHSGPGNSIRSDLPLKKLAINGDVLFVAQNGTGSFEETNICSLQTGGFTEILNRLIESTEETEDDIIFHLKEGISLDDTIHVDGCESQKWQLGKWWKKKTISLVELQKLWEKTVRTAKPRKK